MVLSPNHFLMFVPLCKKCSSVKAACPEVNSPQPPRDGMSTYKIALWCQQQPLKYDLRF